MGAGIWHPDGPSLRRIREGIVEDGGGWRKAVGGKAFKNQLRLSGDSLVRPPQGFDPEHPLLDDLKRKDFIAVAPLTQKTVMAPGFLEESAGLCRAAAPLMAFLCKALELEF
jgi:uncharacterized protein (TIGR02453 family)